MYLSRCSAVRPLKAPDRKRDNSGGVLHGYTYLQKTLPGGIMLIELGFKEVFFRVQVHAFECSRLPVGKNVNPQVMTRNVIVDLQVIDNCISTCLVLCMDNLGYSRKIISSFLFRNWNILWLNEAILYSYANTCIVQIMSKKRYVNNIDGTFIVPPKTAVSPSTLKTSHKPSWKIQRFYFLYSVET